MSAWFVMNAMGLYPATSNHGEYILSSPIFRTVSINLENGKTFKMNVLDNKDDRPYISDVKLNGKAYEHNFFKAQYLIDRRRADFRNE
jgi:putative alpha-1,2-mannosidase